MSTPNNKEHVRLTIAILKEFGIEVTKEEKAEMLSLPTEERVDRWKLKRIKKHWEEYDNDKK